MPTRRGRENKHAEPRDTRPRLGARFVILCALILVVAGAITAISLSMPSGDVPPAPPPAVTAPLPPLGSADPVAARQPWEYDPVNNRHWDPTEGHNHWHAGPPPQPWQYNPETNKHFDPRPGHNHWHDGPAPQDQR